MSLNIHNICGEKITQFSKIRAGTPTETPASSCVSLIIIIVTAIVPRVMYIIIIIISYWYCGTVVFAADAAVKLLRRRVVSLSSFVVEINAKRTLIARGVVVSGPQKGVWLHTFRRSCRPCYMHTVLAIIMSTRDIIIILTIFYWLPKNVVASAGGFVRTFDQISDHM